MNANRFTEYQRTFSQIEFDSNNYTNAFTPQKKGNKVKILAGIDQNNYAISVETEEHEISLISTELIKVRKIQMDEKRMAIIFTLSDEDLLSIFIAFAIDIENTVDQDKDISIVQIYNRYLYWQKMFNVEKKAVSESVIKGLINELYILEKLMIPKYGSANAVRGWIGTENERKDFAYSDGVWYEAKAINLGKSSIKIASIEQLEASDNGFLLVSQLEKTSPENPNGIRLIDQINRIKDLIEIEDIKYSFFSKINLTGLTLDIISNPEHTANKFRYIIHDIHSYLVSDSFPRLKREELPKAITNISYEILIAEIQDYKVDFE